MHHFLAIDQGTSGTKAIVVDEAGQVLSIAEVSVRPEYLSGGGVEQDPEALFDSVVSAGQKALVQADVAVAAVALANQGETVLAWDRDSGRPLTPAVVWQDRRAESICAPLQASADTVAQRTGLVLDPYFSAPKMAWIRANMTTAGVVTTTDTWLVHRLCGAFVTDASTASRSLLTSLDSAEWDDELIGLFGLTGEALPEIVDCDQIIGSTNAFGPTMPVAGLIVDQQAALLAESCLMQGLVAEALGAYKMLLYFAPDDAETAQLVQELEAQAYEKGSLVLRTDARRAEELPDFAEAPAGAAIDSDPAVKRAKWMKRIEILQGMLQRVERYRSAQRPTA